MQKFKIQNHEGLRKLDIKRFYPPFTVTDECPVCGKVIEGCGATEYLSYPVVNAPMSVDFCCEENANGEPHVTQEWSREIIIRVTADYFTCDASLGGHRCRLQAGHIGKHQYEGISW